MVRRDAFESKEKRRVKEDGGGVRLRSQREVAALPAAADSPPMTRSRSSRGAPAPASSGGVVAATLWPKAAVAPAPRQGQAAVRGDNLRRRRRRQERAVATAVGGEALGGGSGVPSPSSLADLSLQPPPARQHGRMQSGAPLVQEAVSGSRRQVRQPVEAESESEGRSDCSDVEIGYGYGYGASRAILSDFSYSDSSSQNSSDSEDASSCMTTGVQPVPRIAIGSYKGVLRRPTAGGRATALRAALPAGQVRRMVSFNAQVVVFLGSDGAQPSGVASLNEGHGMRLPPRLVEPSPSLVEIGAPRGGSPPPDVSASEAVRRRSPSPPPPQPADGDAADASVMAFTASEGVIEARGIDDSGEACETPKKKKKKKRKHDEIELAEGGQTIAALLGDQVASAPAAADELAVNAIFGPPTVPPLAPLRVAPGEAPSADAPAVSFGDGVFDRKAEKRRRKEEKHERKKQQVAEALDAHLLQLRPSEDHPKKKATPPGKALAPADVPSPFSWGTPGNAAAQGVQQAQHQVGQEPPGNFQASSFWASASTSASPAAGNSGATAASPFDATAPTQASAALTGGEAKDHKRRRKADDSESSSDSGRNRRRRRRSPGRRRRRDGRRTGRPPPGYPQPWNAWHGPPPHPWGPPPPGYGGWPPGSHPPPGYGGPMPPGYGEPPVAWPPATPGAGGIAVPAAMAPAPSLGSAFGEPAPAPKPALALPAEPSAMQAAPAVSALAPVVAALEASVALATPAASAVAAIAPAAASVSPLKPSQADLAALVARAAPAASAALVAAEAAACGSDTEGEDSSCVAAVDPYAVVAVDPYELASDDVAVPEGFEGGEQVAEALAAARHRRLEDRRPLGGEPPQPARSIVVEAEASLAASPAEPAAVASGPCGGEDDVLALPVWAQTPLEYVQLPAALDVEEGSRWLVQRLESTEATARAERRGERAVRRAAMGHVPQAIEGDDLPRPPPNPEEPPTKAPKKAGAKAAVKAAQQRALQKAQNLRVTEWQDLLLLELPDDALGYEPSKYTGTEREARRARRLQETSAQLAPLLTAMTLPAWSVAVPAQQHLQQQAFHQSLQGKGLPQRLAPLGLHQYGGLSAPSTMQADGAAHPHATVQAVSGQAASSFAQHQAAASLWQANITKAQASTRPASARLASARPAPVGHAPPAPVAVRAAPLAVASQAMPAAVPVPAPMVAPSAGPAVTHAAAPAAAPAAAASVGRSGGRKKLQGYEAKLLALLTDLEKLGTAPEAAVRKTWQRLSAEERLRFREDLPQYAPLIPVEACAQPHH